tara:strand:- start:989 stop:1150 length:162 start_codon:yes stop_codon:yes gene_type:complete
MNVKKYKGHIYLVVSNLGAVMYKGSLFGCNNYIKINKKKKHILELKEKYCFEK